jgi:transposase-like protein
MNIVRIYQLFPTEPDCIAHLEKVRWKGKPVCAYCGSDRSTPLPAEQRHHCNNCKTTFSVTVGTIFHHTHLPLQKWLLAVSIVLNAKKGLSARQLARDLEVNKNTGWRVGMQIRKAMAEREQRELLSGVVEMVETYIGGKPRPGNGPKGGEGQKKNKRGRGTKKTSVVGMIERGGFNHRKTVDVFEQTIARAVGAVS